MAIAARIARANPTGLDRLSVDAIALPFFQVRAQPRGVAGAADWRLCGRLARMLRDGVFLGALGEHTLMPSMGRFGAARLFLLGLGDPTDVTGPTIVGRLTNITSVLFEAGAKELAVAPPTPATSGDVTAATWWIEAIGKSGHKFERVLLLDSDGALEAGRAELTAAAKKAGLQLSES
ncbi:MAG: M17 family peptidase N-terminal domain-containing protein [Deltaproteobacteria bacterium]